MNFCEKIREFRNFGRFRENKFSRISRNFFKLAKFAKINELSKHCKRNHDPEKDLEVTIVDYGIEKLEERERMEDKIICRLQTHQCNKGGMNLDTHAYAKEMYNLWAQVNSKT